MPEKKWRKGDKAWILYRYTPMGAAPTQVELEESPDKRGYVGVRVPSMLGGGTFGCLVTTGHLHETKEEAERVLATLPPHEETPQ